MRIIGFVGMPGSGKSVASSVARRMGVRVVVMGDVIRLEAKARGLAPTDANHGMVGDDLRAVEGPCAVARRCLAGVEDNNLVVVDGIRSIDEVDYFREAADRFHLIEVFTTPQARLQRIAARGRTDDVSVKSRSGDLTSASSTATGGDADAGDAILGSEDLPCEEDLPDVRIVSSCCSDLRGAAESLERRECRELGWGMQEAIRAADVRISSDGTLEDFQRRIRDLLVELMAL